MTTQLAIKTDPNLKKTAQKKAAEQGVTLTSVMNAFLRRFAEGEFEFKLMSTKESDITIDELFKSKKIVKKANQISKYLANQKL